jgi:hypothetical protein
VASMQDISEKRCVNISFRSSYLFCLLTVGVEVVYFHLITLRHTPQSVRLLWKRDRPERGPPPSHLLWVAQENRRLVLLSPLASSTRWYFAR